MAKLEYFQLFETASMMYLVGSDRHEVSFCNIVAWFSESGIAVTFIECKEV